MGKIGEIGGKQLRFYYRNIGLMVPHGTGGNNLNNIYRCGKL